MLRNPANGKHTHAINSSIAMEMVKPDTWHAFTLNLPSPPANVLTAHAEYYEYMEAHVGCISGIDYEFGMELSAKGRAHIHGIVNFKDEIAIVRWYEFLSSIKEINYEFDTILELHAWKEYMFKCRKYIEPYLEQHGRTYLIKPDPHRAIVGIMMGKPVAIKPKRKK